VWDFHPLFGVCRLGRTLRDGFDALGKLRLVDTRSTLSCKLIDTEFVSVPVFDSI